MKQMTRINRTTYRWWRESGEDIVETHVEALEEAAEDRIREMTTHGFTCGELLGNIHMTEDGIAYVGSWEVEEIVQ